LRHHRFVLGKPLMINESVDDVGRHRTHSTAARSGARSGTSTKSNLESTERDPPFRVPKERPSRNRALRVSTGPGEAFQKPPSPPYFDAAPAAFMLE
jgi:hypothetical protein